MRVRLLQLAIAILLWPSRCGSDRQTLNEFKSYKGTAMAGAGSTLAAPLYECWAERTGLAKTHDQTECGPLQKQIPALVARERRFSYQAIGSGDGLQQFMNGAVLFAGTDWPFPLEPSCADGRQRLAPLPSAITQIPAAVGGIAIIYNLPDSPRLRFRPTLLAKIFAGEMKTWGQVESWNDREFEKDNNQNNLPSEQLPLRVIHRGEPSGTSRVLAEFLAKHSSEWQERIKNSKNPLQPEFAGNQAQGSMGVVDAVSSQDGAIGYVEDYYIEPANPHFATDRALPGTVQVARVKNQKGEFVLSSIGTIEKAAMRQETERRGEVRLNDERLECAILDSDYEGAYPISTFTWLVLPRAPNPDVKPNLCRFLRYGMDHQGEVPGIGYGSLPDNPVDKSGETIVDKNRKAIDELCPSRNIDSN